MKFKNLFTFGFPFALAILGFSNSGLSQEKMPQLPGQKLQKNLIQGAVQIKLTPRGQKYFSTNLPKVLGNLGISFEVGSFAAQDIKAETPLDLKSLEKNYPKEVQLFYAVRDYATQFLLVANAAGDKPFKINDPRPAIHIENSDYTAHITHLGLKTDSALMKALGKTDGAVLVLDLEIEKLSVTTKGIRVWDQDNSILGQVGLDDIRLTVGEAVKPLTAHIPFFVRIQPNGALEFQALKVTDNVSSVLIVPNYKNIVVPSVSLNINGTVLKLNNANLEKYVNSLTPQFLDFARNKLNQFIDQQLPDLLNKKSKELVSGGIEQVQLMEAPGADPHDIRPPFLWGLQLQKFLLKDEQLNIGFAAYAEDTYKDPKSPLPVPGLVPSLLSRGAPTFNGVPEQHYDLAMSLDRGLINRILQLSFNRKNFESIPQKDGTKLTLTDVPTIDYAPPPPGAAKKHYDETYLKLHLSIERQLDPGLANLVVKNPIGVTFDAYIKLAQAKDKSGLELILHSIDFNSVVVDKKYFKGFIGGLFETQVMNGVKAKLKEVSDNWISGQEKIPGALELPPQILGLKLDVVELASDPAGHIVIYSNFNIGN